MNYPLVTIGIPTYNQGKYIADAVGSALAQDYPNLEVIVADDRSSSDTRQSLQPFLNDPRFRFYRNEKNLGRAGNYRKLLYDYAMGDWYVNLDGDDWLTDTAFISRGMEMISRQQSRVILYQACSIVGQATGSDIVKKYPLRNSSEVMKGTTFLLRNFELGGIQHLAALYDRKQAMQLDFYRSPALRSDSESLLRLCMHGDVILHNIPVGKWRETGENETWQLNEQSLHQEMKVYDDVAEYAKAFIDEATISAWKRKAHRHLRFYYLASMTSQGKNGRLLWKFFAWDKRYFSALARYTRGKFGRKTGQRQNDKA